MRFLLWLLRAEEILPLWWEATPQRDMREPARARIGGRLMLVDPLVMEIIYTPDELRTGAAI